MWSANITVHGHYCLTSSVSLFIITAFKKLFLGMKPAAHWSSTTFSHIFTVWLISLSHLYLLGLCTSPLLLENQHQHICSMIVFNSQFKNSTALFLSLSLSARYHTCTGLPSGPHALPLSIPFTAALTSSLLTLCISWITNRHPSLLPHLSLIFLHSPQSTPSNLFNTPPSLAGTFPPLSSIQTCCTSFPHRCKSFFFSPYWDDPTV